VTVAGTTLGRCREPAARSDKMPESGLRVCRGTKNTTRMAAATSAAVTVCGREVWVGRLLPVFGLGRLGLPRPRGAYSATFSLKLSSSCVMTTPFFNLANAWWRFDLTVPAGNQGASACLCFRESSRSNGGRRRRRWRKGSRQTAPQVSSRSRSSRQDQDNRRVARCTRR